MKHLTKSKGFRIFVLIVCAFFVLSFVFVGLYFFGVFKKDGGDAFDDTSSRPAIEELWDGSTFSKANFDKLMHEIDSNNSASSTNMSNIYSLAANKTTSFTMRNNNGGTDIIVTLCGLTWSPTYLSKDKNGNSILTLWLTDSDQLAEKKYASWATFDENGASTWNNGFSPSNELKGTYPDAMYGSSYMHSVVLNNGGGYLTAHRASSLSKSSPSSSSVFAPFTMSTSSLTEFIVKPNDVSWQENEQSAVARLSIRYNLPNDNWSNSVPDTGFYKDSDGNYYNYAHRPGNPAKGEKGNDAWKTDYLWLPSVTEIGTRSGNFAYDVGIWNTTAEQRESTEGYWLRSGEYSDAAKAYYNKYGLMYSALVNCSYGVRPALHLNLNKMANNINELWIDSAHKFNSESLKALLQAISGDSGVSLSDISKIEKMAKNGTNAQEMITNNNKQEITVTLGGLTWTPTYLSTTKAEYGEKIILTLWLSDSIQLSGKTYAIGKTFDENGTSTWNSGYSPGDNPYAKYPDNMYGSSYIRSVVLNNGGGYLNQKDATSLEPYSSDKSSVFAKFTMAENDGNYNDLTEFIVTPENVSWQESGQSAISQGVNENNLSNENWSQSISNDGFYYNSSYKCYYNYAGKTGNDVWKNDHLWLPSRTETGYDDSHNGMWNISSEQRQNSSLSWLRSGNRSSAYSVAVHSSVGFYTVQWTKCTVRPALHLCLSDAISSLEKYYITFNGGDGGKINGLSAVDMGEKKFGEIIDNLYPSKTGYTFDYFTNDATNKKYTLNADGTFTVPDLGTNGGRYILTAHWIANKYTITADPKEGTITGNTSEWKLKDGYYTKEVTFDTNYGALPTVKRTGYTYEWKFNDKIITSGTKMEDDAEACDHTITAVWTPIKYNIHFEPNDVDINGDKLLSEVNGTMSDDKGVEYDKEHEITYSYTCLTYNFIGWKLKGDESEALYTRMVKNLTSKSGEMVTLVAQWEPTWATEVLKEEKRTGQPYTPEKSLGMYQISSSLDLAWIAREAAAGNLMNKKYDFKQTADINLDGHTWLPIGQEVSWVAPNGTEIKTSNVYYVDFEGDEHMISHLKTSTYDLPKEDFANGLFGSVGDVDLCRVNIVSGNISGSTNVGSFVGAASDYLYIENCTNLADVSGVDKVGGLAGAITYGCELYYCVNYGDVTGDTCVGGLIGYVPEDADWCVFIEDCYVRVDEVSGNSKVGGFVGEAAGTVYISGTAFLGTITGGNGFIGDGYFCIDNCLAVVQTYMALTPDDNSDITDCIMYYGEDKNRKDYGSISKLWVKINDILIPSDLLWYRPC